MIEPALERPSPRTRASPVPRKVSARPLTTWSARRWMAIDGMQQAEHAAGQHGDHEAEPGVAGRDGGREPCDRADEHHPGHAEVQDPGPLGEDLADRGEEQDGAAGDAGGQDQREVHQAGAAALPGPIRTR